MLNAKRKLLFRIFYLVWKLLVLFVVVVSLTSFYQNSFKVAHKTTKVSVDFDISTEDLFDNYDWVYKSWSPFNQTNIPDCFQSNSSELRMWHPPSADFVHDDPFLSAKNCNIFRSVWNFPKKPTSKEEAHFPLAYVVMGYRSLRQTLRLFRAIYAPQNVYCINWDEKSETNYQNTLISLSTCFDNVISPTLHRTIKWCNYTLLQATMDCLQLLHETKMSWKYVQIVSWNDFPLKTNKEMVQTFQILNGSLDSEMKQPQFHTFVYDINKYPKFVPKRLPPAGIVLYKGSYATSMTREFIKFVFTNDVSLQLFQWLSSSYCSEEMYFSTLMHNSFLHAPAGFPGVCLQFYKRGNVKKSWISRYQTWSRSPQVCYGKMVHDSCVFGVGDVVNLKNQFSLMAHKFYSEFQPAALYCVEQWHYSKIQQGMGLTKDMINYYSNMQSVKFHNLNKKDKLLYTCIDK